MEIASLITRLFNEYEDQLEQAFDGNFRRYFHTSYNETINSPEESVGGWIENPPIAGADEWIQTGKEELNEDLIKWRYTNKRTGENRYDLKDRRGHYANKNRLTGK